jgi:peptide/nickel transport system substrate-binding protein
MGPTERQCALPCLEPLIGGTEKGAPYTPLLATAWKYSPDYKSLMLSLRKGVKFHDGTDFNAQAVKYNLEKAKPTKSELASVSSIDVIDDYTVRLNLTQYNNLLLYNLGPAAGLIASPTAIEKNGKQWAYTHPVGTGPFKFVSYQRDVSLKYEKFAGYWDKGKPYLDGVEFIFITDPTVARMSFERGEAHVIVPSIRDAYELSQKGFKVSTCPYQGYPLGGDSANPASPFANKKVREAMEHAIDKEAIAKAFGYGFFIPMMQICPSDARQSYNPRIKGRAYNPARAKELLAEAGYASGFKTKIINRQGQETEVWTAVQRYFKEVGIDAELDLADAGRYMTTIQGGEWKNSLLVMGLASYEPYTLTLLRSLASRSVQYRSVARPSGWDDLLNRALAATDNKIAVSFTHALVQMAFDEALVIPVYTSPAIAIKQPSIQGDNISTYHRFVWTPGEAWLSR